MFSAVLDTCVLVPSLTRDILLEVASCGVYRPIWSDQILSELSAVVTAMMRERSIGEGEAVAYVKRLLAAMGQAFPDAAVRTPPELVAAMRSPDPDDRHVIAAAVAGRADVIVTNDKSGFPRELLPPTLLTQTADVFLTYSLDLHPALVMQAVTNVAARTGRHGPRRTVSELLDLVERRSLAEFAADLRGRT